MTSPTKSTRSQHCWSVQMEVWAPALLTHWWAMAPSSWSEGERCIASGNGGECTVFHGGQTAKAWSWWWPCLPVQALCTLANDLGLPHTAPVSSRVQRHASTYLTGWKRCSSAAWAIDRAEWVLPPAFARVYVSFWKILPPSKFGEDVQWDGTVFRHQGDWFWRPAPKLLWNIILLGKDVL